MRHYPENILARYEADANNFYNNFKQYDFKGLRSKV